MGCFLKYLVVAGVCILASNNCSAQQISIQHYINLISSGNYEILSNVSYNNHSNEKQESLRKEAVLAQLGDKKYIHIYVEKTGEKSKTTIYSNAITNRKKSITIIHSVKSP